MRGLFTVNEFISAMSQRGLFLLSEPKFVTECSTKLAFSDQKSDRASIECILAGSEPFFSSISFRATFKFPGDYKKLLQAWTYQPRLFDFELNQLPDLGATRSAAPFQLIEFLMHIDHPGGDLTLTMLCVIRIWNDALNELRKLLAQV